VGWRGVAIVTVVLWTLAVVLTGQDGQTWLFGVVLAPVFARWGGARDERRMRRRDPEPADEEFEPEPERPEDSPVFWVQVCR